MKLDRATVAARCETTARVAVALTLALVLGMIAAVGFAGVTLQDILSNTLVTWLLLLLCFTCLAAGGVTALIEPTTDDDEPEDQPNFHRIK